MESGDAVLGSARIRVESRYRTFVCAWTAYVGPAAQLLVLALIGYGLANMALVAGLTWLLLALAMFVYRVLMIHSIRLFTHDDGVWIYRGVFPWNTGVYGVKWHDLDEATYTPAFLGWLLNSYRVRIAHRFTKSSEIVALHIKDGDKAASHINDLHISHIRAGTLQNDDGPTPR